MHQQGQKGCGMQHKHAPFGQKRKVGMSVQIRHTGHGQSAVRAAARVIRQDKMPLLPEGRQRRVERPLRKTQRARHKNIRLIRRQMREDMTEVEQAAGRKIYGKLRCGHLFVLEAH